MPGAQPDLSSLLISKPSLKKFSPPDPAFAPLAMPAQLCCDLFLWNADRLPSRETQDGGREGPTPGTWEPASLRPVVSTTEAVLLDQLQR